MYEECKSQYASSSRSGISSSINISCLLEMISAELSSKSLSKHFSINSSFVMLIAVSYGIFFSMKLRALSSVTKLTLAAKQFAAMVLYLMGSLFPLVFLK